MLSGAGGERSEPLAESKHPYPWLIPAMATNLLEWDRLTAFHDSSASSQRSSMRLGCLAGKLD
jgi:hypothetical protein